MSEQEKYAEIYRDQQPVTAAGRAAFGGIWRGSVHVFVVCERAA